MLRSHVLASHVEFAWVASCAPASNAAQLGMSTPWPHLTCCKAPQACWEIQVSACTWLVWGWSDCMSTGGRFTKRCSLEVMALRASFHWRAHVAPVSFYGGATVAFHSDCPVTGISVRQCNGDLNLHSIKGDESLVALNVQRCWPLPGSNCSEQERRSRHGLVCYLTVQTKWFFGLQC